MLKIKTNKIQVIFMNEAAEDTMIVDLKQLKQKNNDNSRVLQTG